MEDQKLVQVRLGFTPDQFKKLKKYHLDSEYGTEKKVNRHLQIIIMDKIKRGK